MPDVLAAGWLWEQSEGLFTSATTFPDAGGQLPPAAGTAHFLRIREIGRIMVGGSCSSWDDKMAEFGVGQWSAWPRQPCIATALLLSDLRLQKIPFALQ